MTNWNGDLIELSSAWEFEETLLRVEEAIRGAGLTIFARIDHALAARDTGQAMPPATVLIYGNPRIGTPIMLAAPLTALDLPLRVLVQERPDGRTEVAFHPSETLLRRAGVPEELAGRLLPAQHLIVNAING